MVSGVQLTMKGIFILLLFSLSLRLANAAADSQYWPKLFDRKLSHLAVDGSWSSWQGWSPCYNNTKYVEHFYAPWENFIVQKRNRSCDSPKPHAGGEECQPPSHRFRQCSCMNPLGVGSSNVKESEITSSRYLDGYSSSQVGLDQDSNGWCSKTKLSLFCKTYIQIEFLHFATVHSILTLGNTKGRIRRFKLQYSINGKEWSHVLNGIGKKLFNGNILPGKLKRNKFESAQIIKYLKVIPTETFGLPCLKMEVYGCSFTCGGLMTSSFGEIVARSSPKIDQNCLWRIEVLNTTSLTFDFNVFFVLCEQGYLDFYDGNFPFNNAPLLDRKCLRNEDEELSLFKINKNKVWLKFVSNSSLTEVGFNIRYFSECAQTIHLKEGEEVIIETPNYPQNYFDNLKCTWVVYSPLNLNTISIKTNDFSIESSRNLTSPCSDDVVVFETNSNKKVGSYCNNNKPPNDFMISTQKLMITFMSDLISTEKGFSFMLISGKKKILTTENPGTQKFQNNYESFSTPSIKGNNDSNTSVKEIKKEKDDTWTVIIICAFSAFAIVLLCIIIGTNIRRFLKNRNDLEAHCAKIREQERKKSKHEKLKLMNKEYKCQGLLPNAPCPKKVLMPVEGNPLINKTDNCNETQDSSEESLIKQTLSLADSIQPHHSSAENVEHNTDDVDGGGDSCSFDSSSPQIHSPLKSVKDHEFENQSGSYDDLTPKIHSSLKSIEDHHVEDIETNV